MIKIIIRIIVIIIKTIIPIPNINRLNVICTIGTDCYCVLFIRQIKLNTKYYENCETVLMKYLKDACGLSAFSDQVIIIIIIAIIIIAIIIIAIIKTIVVIIITIIIIAIIITVVVVIIPIMIESPQV